MVAAVRAGQSLRQVANTFRVDVSTVAYWVERAHGDRIDRVEFANRKPGRAWNRTPARTEQRILRACEKFEKFSANRSTAMTLVR